MSSSISDISDYLTTNSSLTEVYNSGSDLDKEDFLTMLAAQLSNQDPTAPVDSKDLVLQLSQFSTLEATTNLNNNMSTFIDNTTVATLSSLIGKQITYYDSDLGASVIGNVDSVKFSSDGSMKLSVDGVDVDPSYVTTISNPSTTTGSDSE